MPNPDRPGSDERQADARMLEFIRERRERGERHRRHQMMVAAIAALALIAVVLAISNALLIKRLMAGGPTSTPSVASVPATRPETSSPATGAPAAPGPSAPPATTAPPAPPAPAAPVPQTDAPRPADLPSAAAPAAPPSAAAPAVPQAAPATSGDPAQRTARWLVQTHGRVEAESRAAKVAEFYRGEEGAFWRRVLLNVRREPER